MKLYDAGEGKKAFDRADFLILRVWRIKDIVGNKGKVIKSNK